MGGYIVYDKFIASDSNQVSNNDIGNNSLDLKTYTVSSVAGLYEHEVGTYEDGEKKFARVYLDENGNLNESKPISKNNELVSNYAKQSSERTKTFVDSMGSLVKWLNDGYYFNNQNK